MESYKLLLHVLRPAKKSLMLTFLFSFLTVAANIGLLGTSAWLLATAALHPNLSTLTLSIVGVRFYGISRAVCRYIERYVSHHMAFQGLYALRVWFYKRIEPLAPAIFKDFGSGDILGRIIGDIETLQFFYLRVLMPPLTAVCITLGLAYYLGQFSWLLALLLWVAFFVTGVLLPLGVFFHNKKMSSEILLERSALKGEIAESLSGMQDIVAFERRDAVSQTLSNKFEELSKKQDKVAQGNQIGDAVFQLLLYVTTISSFFITIPLFGSEKGVYIAVVALLYQSYFEALQPLSLALHYNEESRLAVSRLQAIHGASQEKNMPNDHEDVIGATSAPILNEAASIIFEHVDFSYGKEQVLRDFSLHIHSGEKVGIVGPSGSGKTTLFMILSRFYDYEGKIFIGNRELASFSPEEMRMNLGVMEQEPYLFHATIEENFRLAKPQSTDLDLSLALESASLTNYVKFLPDGMKTIIGSGGNSVSGGQKQRLALARLFLKDAPILLLDEPLEGLDQVTRKAMQESLFSLMERKTCLYITHQLEGLERLDRIIFFENGFCKEMGSYEELMNRKGAFYTYVEMSLARLG